MATKRLTGYASGSTLYDLFRDEDGNVLNNTTFALVAWVADTRDDYAFTLTDSSGDLYTGDFDANFPIGVTLYRSSYVQAGANPDDADTLAYGPIRIEWTGETVMVDGEDVSITALCNHAFMKLGGAWEQDKLASYFEESKSADLCQRLWPQIRKEVLIRGGKEGVNWNEAHKYAECGAALTGDNIPDMAEWEYSFSLPSDCLRVIAQVSESAHTTEYAFEVMRNMLLTNELTNDGGDTAYIRYIFDEDDVTNYSPTLYAAMVTKLAAEMAPTIADNKRRVELLQEFEDLVMSLASGKNQAEVYHDDKGKTDVAGRRHNPYGRKS